MILRVNALTGDHAPIRVIEWDYAKKKQDGVMYFDSTQVSVLSHRVTLRAYECLLQYRKWLRTTFKAKRELDNICAYVVAVFCCGSYTVDLLVRWSQ